MSLSPTRSVGKNTVARLELEPVADKLPSTSVRPLVSATAVFEDSTGDDTLGVDDGGGIDLAIPTDILLFGFMPLGPDVQ